MEGGVHTKIAGVYHRVFWETQRKLQRHTEEIRSSLRKCMAFLIRKVEKRTGDCFSVALWFIP